MSGAPVLPFPKVRELWAAQSGRLFFFKWMIAAALGVLFKSAWIWIVLRMGIPFRAGLASDILYYCAPVLIQFWVLFGFRWRLWLWLGLDITTAFLSGGAFLRGWLVPVAIRATWQTLLVIGVRRRPTIWFIALLAAHAIEYVAEWSAPVKNVVDAAINHLSAWGFGAFWLRIQVNCTIQFLMAIFLGAAVAWLMPPVRSSKKITGNAIA